MSRTMRFPLVLITGAVVLAACGRGPGTGTESPPATASPSVPTTSSPDATGLRVWIAVFETALDPNDLEGEARTLMERAGTAVVVSPEGCYEGLRGRDPVDPGDYVLAVVASSREELDAAIDRSGRDPVLTDMVEDLCPL
jgi:hypothetical protein